MRVGEGVKRLSENGDVASCLRRCHLGSEAINMIGRGIKVLAAGIDGDMRLDPAGLSRRSVVSKP
jgi:hypothetical protein